MMRSTPYRIGICTDYDDSEAFTVACVEFNVKGDVIVWSPTGDDHALRDGTKWNPHVTYHVDGEYHLASYTRAHHLPRHVRYPHERKRQPLDDSFSGSENLVIQGYSPDFAEGYGRCCTGFDSTLVTNARSFEHRVDVISDHLGTMETPLPTASFQVDLVEPNRHELIKLAVLEPDRIIAQVLVQATFPWCLVTILRQALD